MGAEGHGSTECAFTFYIEVEPAVIHADAIWPVGYEDKRRETPTAADVVAFIKSEYGSMSAFLREWNLLPYNDIAVSVDQEQLDFSEPVQPNGGDK